MLDFENLWLRFTTWFALILPSIVRVALVIIIALVLSHLIPKVVRRIWKGLHADTAAQHYVTKTVKILLWGVAAIICLDMFGFPVASFLTVIAAVGAAVALAVKDNLANLASGLVLMFTKPFKAGDFIEVDGVSGTIRHIEMMHTYLDTPTNTCAAVPNTKMTTATIVNYSAHEFRRQDLFYSISYGDDVAKAKDILLKLAGENELVLDRPETAMAVVSGHDASGVALLLRFWCAPGNFHAVRFQLNESVKLAFDENGITIPFPQLSVHIQNDERKKSQ